MSLRVVFDEALMFFFFPFLYHDVSLFPFVVFPAFCLTGWARMFLDVFDVIDARPLIPLSSLVYMDLFST